MQNGENLHLAAADAVNHLSDPLPDLRMVDQLTGIGVAEPGLDLFDVPLLRVEVRRNGFIIPLKMSYASGVRWMPDGRALIVRGTDLKGRRGLFGLPSMAASNQWCRSGRPGSWSTSCQLTEKQPVR